MSVFNFLEPAVTIIAQTIPMFRVLLVTVKRGTQNGMHITSPTSRSELVVARSNSLENRCPVCKLHGHPDNLDHELLHVHVGPGGKMNRDSGPSDLEAGRFNGR